MSMRGGFFGGGKGKHPNLEHIAQALQSYLGLELVAPAPDVLAVIDAMALRELRQFDNLRSVEGMQELFRARSIHAAVDQATGSVTLVLAPAAELEQQLKAEHAQVRVMHVELGQSTARIVRAPAPDPLLAATDAAQPTEPLPPGFDHLEALERLRGELVNLFVKQGRLSIADKEVLKKILPADGSFEARLAALERWQAEMARRTRGLMTPKATQPLMLAGEVAAPDEPAQALVRRYDTLLHWVARLIKAFESTGVRFHNKPMWLPH